MTLCPGWANKTATMTGMTCETLKNKDFGERVMMEIPQSVMDGALLKEEVAAKAGPVMS
jgi:hypothetical protein